MRENTKRLQILSLPSAGGFPGGSVVKTLPVMQETKVQPLGWEDPLEEETATHSSIRAWRFPWTVALQVAKSWT